MKFNSRSIAVIVGGALSAALLATVPQSAQAQVAAPEVRPAVRSNNAGMKTLESVLTRMSREANIQIVADSTVSQTLVTPLTEATTPENYAVQIETMLKSLPRGASWAKLYLPALSGSRTFNGDDVADYALAQAKLFGKVGEATPPGTIEVMGRRVGADKVESVVAALNLKPVVLITNPSAKADNGMVGTNPKWAAMSPEEQKAYAATQAQKFLGLAPAQQQQAVQQQMAIFSQMMQQMSPEQRQQMFQGMGGAMGGGGGRPQMRRRGNN